MSHAYAARGARQTAVLAAIIGLHFAVLLVIALDLGPQPPPTIKKTYPVKPIPREPEKPVVEKPTVELIPGWQVQVERPDVFIPDFPLDDKDAPSVPQQTGVGAGSDAGSGPYVADIVYPKLRTRPASVAAAINACYPAASRRMNEEGTVVALVSIGTNGKAVNWSVAKTSGFARLDSAIACVLQKLDFVAGRQDGQAVLMEAQLPIVFRLD